MNRLGITELVQAINADISLTSIAGLVHVNDLNLTTLILVSPCHTCSVYAIKKFGYFLWHIPNMCHMKRPKSGS